MSLFDAALVPAPIARVNPVARIGATIPLGMALILSIDWVSALVALGLEVVLFLAVGLGPVLFSRRLLPIWIAAPFSGLTMLLYGQVSGQTYWRAGLIHVTEGSVDLGVALTLRVLAVALPAVVLFVTIDPVDLADGLAQILRLPARFVLGALAGLRLLGLFIEDWRSLERARRARGVADRGLIRRFLGQAFALLVLSIRRGSKLATAMEARGMGADTPRSWARESVFGGREWAFMAIGLMVAMVAVAASVSTGHWNLIIGPGA